MLTTNQKHTTDSQKQERKAHKHDTKKKNHWTTRQEKSRIIKQKTRNKMSINTCQSIITLYVNRLNAQVKRYKVADCI